MSHQREAAGSAFAWRRRRSWILAGWRWRISGHCRIHGEIRYCGAHPSGLQYDCVRKRRRQITAHHSARTRNCCPNATACRPCVRHVLPSLSFCNILRRYPLYEVPGSHMHASTLRCIRCVTALARILIPSARVYKHWRSLLIRRVLSSYLNRAQVLPPVCRVWCACLLIPSAVYFGSFTCLSPLTIVLTGIVIVHVQLLFLVPGD